MTFKDIKASERAGIVNLAIPASQAFGTGQHETTSGCLVSFWTNNATGASVNYVNAFERDRGWHWQFNFVPGF